MQMRYENMSESADFQTHLPHPDLGALATVNHELFIPYLQYL